MMEKLFLSAVAVIGLAACTIDWSAISSLKPNGTSAPIYSKACITEKEVIEA